MNKDSHRHTSSRWVQIANQVLAALAKLVYPQGTGPITNNNMPTIGLSYIVASLLPLTANCSALSDMSHDKDPADMQDGHLEAS
jgi:hypothetical protein